MIRSIAASSSRSIIRCPPYFFISLSSYSSAISATSRRVATSSSASSVWPPRIVWVNSTVCSVGSTANAPNRRWLLSSSSCLASGPSTSTPLTSWDVQRTIARLSPHGTTLIMTYAEPCLMTYSESSTLRYAGELWSVRSIRSAVATSAGFMHPLLARVPSRVIGDARGAISSCHTARRAPRLRVVRDRARRRSHRCRRRRHPRHRRGGQHQDHVRDRRADRQGRRRRRLDQRQARPDQARPGVVWAVTRRRGVLRPVWA